MKYSLLDGTTGREMPGLIASLASLWATFPGELMLWQLLLLMQRLLQELLLLVSILLLRVLAASAVITIANFIPVLTSAAIAASTSPAWIQLTTPKLYTSGQGMAGRPVWVPMELLRLDKGSLQSIYWMFITQSKPFMDEV